MLDEPSATSANRQLTARIVAAYVRHNPASADELGSLLSTVHRTLADLGKSPSETPRGPAVPIRRSVHRDYVVCLECGLRGQMLRRHIRIAHGLSIGEYRAKWRLDREHPLIAPAYSERRSELAKRIGLGNRRGSRLIRQRRRRDNEAGPSTPAPA